MTETNKIALPGSQRAPLPGAQLVGPTDPNQLVEVSVVLKQRRELKLHQLQGKIMSHDEFASAYGADPEHVKRIHAFAQANNLEVVPQDDEVTRRTVKLQGTVANMEKAFSVKLNDYSHPLCRYRGRTGAVHVPADLADVVQGVFGLDDRPQASPHFRFRGPSFYDRVGASDAAAAANISYAPVQVAQLYNFPQDVTGAGQTIGIIELGGGYNPADIISYFQSLNITPPTVTSVSVDHGTNSPTTPDSADGEVQLDIEVAGSVAPGANIVVYFAPNTSQGFQDAISTAIHDTANNPSVVSISWGASESNWTAQSMQAMDQVAQEAAALGVTITAASGDSGSSDGATDGSNNVDFPSSSPHVLGCGGTSLISSNGVIGSETVWNDGAGGGATGGGFSTTFTQPSFQSSLSSTFPGQTGRGVPDVAGDADPNTGYNVSVDGQQGVIGGTSAVAPLWAGLIALLNQKLNRRLGFVNPSLYALQAPNGFNDITQGDNGAFSAGPGWDPTTGLGSPIGTTLATLLGTPPATQSSS
jgi:kumamolisin